MEDISTFPARRRIYYSGVVEAMRASRPKDYRINAQSIRSHQWELTVKALANSFLAGNAWFPADQFRKDCGMR